MKKRIAFLLCIFLLAGCAGNTHSVVPIAPADNHRLTVATNLNTEVYEPLIVEFENRTGIWVEMVEGNTAQILDMAEKGTCDLVWGIGTDILDQNEALFLELPANSETARRILEGDCWRAVSINDMMIVYNRRLVKKNPPQALEDMTKLIWKGQVAFADPECCDLAAEYLTILCFEKTEADARRIIWRLNRNIGEYAQNCAQALVAVEQGRSCMCIVTDDMIPKGEWVQGTLAAAVPTEGRIRVVRGAAVPRQAEHPENAKKLIDFLLEQNTQRFASEYLGLGSVLWGLGTWSEDDRIYRRSDSNWQTESIQKLWREQRGTAS